MSLWADMIRCASRGAALLGPAADRARFFLQSQLNEDGGLNDRAGVSDLYYTGLGLSAWSAIEPISAGPAVDRQARVLAYLRSFGDGAGLDLIHLSCLARSWACLGGSDAAADAFRRKLPEKIEKWRSADGGFGQEPGAERGTVYGCFLAVGAIQDCGANVPHGDCVARCVSSCRSAGEGFSNSPGEELGLAPATAGAVQVLHALDRPVVPAWGRWLIERCFRGGGFAAHELAPENDLLSTAVALHAVELAGVSLSEDQRRQCSAFVRGLQTEQGGFRGAASDVMADCEYTFYGLLALGHLGDDRAA